MNRSRRCGRGVSALIAALVLAGAPAIAAAETHAAFTIADPRIQAPGGLTRDTGHNVYWIASETDTSGVLYAVGPDGQTRGTMEFSIKPVQIEAVALADTRLYVGDIGDPTRSRAQITVYWFNNAAPNDTRAGSYRAWDFTYPDGPHDAAAILVDKNNQLLIVTREQRGGIYQAPRSPRGSSSNMLTRVGDAPAYVTDATNLPDGRFAVRTYTTVEILDPDSYTTTARAALPPQSKGESLAVSLDGSNLLVGNATPGSQVLQVPVPTTVADIPPAPATPPPVPAAAASPSVLSPTEEEKTNRSGTLLALLGALVVAVGAGVAVLLTPGRGTGAGTGDETEETTVLGRRTGSTVFTPDEDRTVVRQQRRWPDDATDESREIFRRGERRNGSDN